MPLKQRAIFAQGGTGKRLPDHLRHPVLDPVKLLELVSDGHELIDRPDLLLLERFPGHARQIESANRPRAGIKNLRHRTLLFNREERSVESASLSIRRSDHRRASMIRLNGVWAA
jgi:hypothetical protein